MTNYKSKQIRIHVYVGDVLIGDGVINYNDCVDNRISEISNKLIIQLDNLIYGEVSFNDICSSRQKGTRTINVTGDVVYQ